MKRGGVTSTRQNGGSGEGQIYVRSVTSITFDGDHDEHNYFPTGTNI